MARKTFISYKYSEAQPLRDKIIGALGDDATYYQGETADSPDLTDTSVENIKKNLKEMIFGTSVTIVIVSPKMIESKWIDWEIEYSLKEITRADRTSRTNGVVGVIMKVDGSYDWILTRSNGDDGCTIRTLDSSRLYEIIKKNRYNRVGHDKYSCSVCKTFDQLEGSYISLVEEGVFLKNPNKYIENAYDKSRSLCDFDISKLRE